MPVDFTALDASIASLTAEVARSETTEDSAGTLIAGFAAAVTTAVTNALTADAAANQVTIDAANKAIADVTARFSAADDKLGAAITANTPPAPAPAG